MSVKLMTFVWDNYPEGGSELLLALALSDVAEDDGSQIYPSVATMASKTRQSERNIQYLLAKMKEKGWLIEIRPGGIFNGKRYTTEYQIPAQALGMPAPIDRAQTLHPSEEGCKKQRTRVQPSVENGCKAIAPHSSLPINTHGAQQVAPDSTQVEKDQGQNRPAGPACAHCDGPLTGGHTSLRIGNVCNPCYQTYLQGEWKIEERAA